jgi:RNA polymerase sigma-70 factor (ECF subfamily)
VKIKRADKLTDSERQFVEAVFKKYRSSLFNYLRGLLPTQDDAFEALQETYARMAAQPNLRKLETTARGYLFTIATNLVTDIIRRHSARNYNGHFSVDELEFFDQSPQPDALLAWEQSVSITKQSIMELRAKHRQVFVMNRFMNMTYMEIADSLGVSVRTVERRMSTAIGHMKRRLEQHL